MAPSAAGAAFWSHARRRAKRFARRPNAAGNVQYWRCRLETGDWGLETRVVLTLIKVIRAALILLLLAIFLAQLLAPAVTAVQRRVLTRRRRPIARAWAIAAVYVT